MSTDRLHELLTGPVPEGPAAESLAGHFASVAEAEAFAEPFSQPPQGSALPSVERMRDLVARFEADPERVTRVFQNVIERDIDRDEVERILRGAALAVERPDEGVAQLESIRVLAAAKPQLPDDWVEKNIDPRYRDDSIEIDPYDYRFEDDSVGGIWGWAIYNLGKALVPDKREEFRWHDDARWGADRFTYKMSGIEPDKSLRVALFSDYANGLAHARYIARQMVVDENPYAIHLGDIYYTGEYKECAQYFQRPLLDLLRAKKTELFLLADNHERYSGFDGYFWLLDQHHKLGPHRQRGSYFCLANDKFQFVAPDSIYHRRGRIDDKIIAWADKRLRAGREQGKVNILLTSYEPYHHGKKRRNKILKRDLWGLLDDDLVDLWFWGNVHYGALWDRSAKTPFIGSCIGHAGYPYKRKKHDDDQPSRQRWLETGSRYPGTEVRKDRGNNGYCLLDLHHDQSVTLRYMDWRGHQRASFALARRGGEAYLSLPSPS